MFGILAVMVRKIFSTWHFYFQTISFMQYCNQRFCFRFNYERHGEFFQNTIFEYAWKYHSLRKQEVQQQWARDFIEDSITNFMATRLVSQGASQALLLELFTIHHKQ